MSDLKFIKLVNGEEVLGFVSQGDKKKIVVEDPLKVFMAPNINGEISLSFIPWSVLGSEHDVIIPMSSVIAIMDASDEAHGHYEVYLQRKKNDMDFNQQSNRDKQMANEVFSMLPATGKTYLN